MSESTDETRGRFTLAQLADLLKSPRQRVRAWLLAGLIRPVAQAHGVCYFDFRQVAAAKTLCDLTGAGVGIQRIRRSLRQLRKWLPGVHEPLDQLAILEKNGRLLIRLESGLVEPSGQLCFDFGDDAAILGVQPIGAEEWFQLGSQHEQDGALDDAIHAYRQALLVGGPDADACFNLASALYASGQKEEASERDRQTVEIDPALADAWNNLGVLLSEIDRPHEAEIALCKAIQLGFADAHFNLARLLDHCERPAEARAHWTEFVRVQPHGPRSEFARRKLHR